jgi:hypothetical protein
MQDGWYVDTFKDYSPKLTTVVRYVLTNHMYLLSTCLVATKCLTYTTTLYVVYLPYLLTYNPLT